MMSDDEGLEAELLGDRARKDGVARSELARAEACVAAMARHLPLGESEVIWCLEHEDWFGALAIIAKLAGSEVAQAAELFERGGLHGQLILMRTARLSWPVVEWILDKWTPVHRSEMKLHKALYLSLRAPGQAKTANSTEAKSNVVQFDAARRRRAQLELAAQEGSHP